VEERHPEKARHEHSRGIDRYAIERQNYGREEQKAQAEGQAKNATGEEDGIRSHGRISCQRVG
jgi:hypothetical protein